MKLQPTQLAWFDKVTTAARKYGFTVFVQERANQRQHDPSLILTKGPRVILVWLRMGRPKPVPQVEEHRQGGREAYLWYPADWPFVTSAMLLPPVVPRLPDDADRG